MVRAKGLVFAWMLELGARVAFAGLLVLAPAACGGKNGAQKAPPVTPDTSSQAAAPAPAPRATSADVPESRHEHKPEIATGSTLTKFQKRVLLGHYSTRDGMSGFILDRTVTPWRAKLDGVASYVTLKKTNEPRRGMSEYTSDDKTIWIRVDDEEGYVELFQGPKQHEGVYVVRDADADQLK